MRIIYYILLIVTVFASCKPSSERRCAKKTGDITTLIIPNVTAANVTLNDDIGMTIVQDSLNYIELVGGENMLPFIEFSKEGNSIVFQNRNRCNFTRVYEPLIAIYHCTQIDTLLLYGFGGVENQNEYNSDIHIASYESFSSIVLKLNNTNTSIDGQLGSIDATLSGNCDHLYMYANGSGFMDASRLNCKTAHGHSQGIGDFYLNASEEVRVELRSRGDFYITKQASANNYITDEGEGNVFIE